MMRRIFIVDMLLIINIQNAQILLWPEYTRKCLLFSIHWQFSGGRGGGEGRPKGRGVQKYYYQKVSKILLQIPCIDSVSICVKLSSSSSSFPGYYAVKHILFIVCGKYLVYPPSPSLQDIFLWIVYEDMTKFCFKSNGDLVNRKFPLKFCSFFPHTIGPQYQIQP